MDTSFPFLKERLAEVYPQLRNTLEEPTVNRSELPPFPVKGARTVET